MSDALVILRAAIREPDAPCAILSRVARRAVDYDRSKRGVK